MRYAVGRWDTERFKKLNRQFSVSGRSGATGAAANECLCNLWNPDTARSLWVQEFSWSASGNAATTESLVFCRTSTLGTPATTITPDLDNDYEREISADTAATLRLANFTTEPVVVLPALFQLTSPVTGLHALTWMFRGRGLRVPPGTGLALVTLTAVSQPAADITFRFVE